MIENGTGRRVVYASNGREALALIESAAPCVVLTDLQMPVMDGIELVETIRARIPRLPVILMTAFGSEVVAMRALKAGATHYVPKDCLVTDLVETIQQILAVVEGHQRRRQILACQTARASSFELTNDYNLLSPLINLIQEEMLLFSIGDETTRIQVAIALQEALTNALFHGNLECASDLRQEDERTFFRLAEERR